MANQNDALLEDNEPVRVQPIRIPSMHRNYADDPCIGNRTGRTEQLQYQKKWAAIHCVYLVFVSIVLIALLNAKSDALDSFNNQEQCCYCLWVSQHSEVSDNFQIEWSVCKNKDKYSTDLESATCLIDGNQACSADMLSNARHNELSYNFNFFFWTFPSYYPFYGVSNAVLLALYMFFLFTTTCCYKIVISQPLFIANLALIISFYYTFIKLYQFSLYDYDVLCPNPTNHMEPICYKSSFSKLFDLMFSSLVYVATIYVVYCIFVVFPCINCICSRIKCVICIKIGRIISYTVYYAAVIGGSMAVIFLYVVLMWLALRRDNNFGVIINVSDDTERLFVIITANILLILAFDMFFFDHCRQDFIAMFPAIFGRRKKRHSANYSVHSLLESAESVDGDGVKT